MPTNCAVCALPEDRKRLAEKLHDEGKSVEEIGISFRIDFDVLEEHFAAHLNAEESVLHTGTKRTVQVLDELQDMIEAARTDTENDPDPARKTAYATLVKLYHTIAMEMKDREDKELENAKQAQVVLDELVRSVMDPMLKDMTEVIITELSKLKEVLNRVGVSSSIEGYFGDATRRIGAGLSQTAEPYVEVMRTCVDGTAKKKRKKKN